jgi:hypothetical protein
VQLEGNLPGNLHRRRPPAYSRLGLPVGFRRLLAGKWLMIVVRYFHRSLNIPKLVDVQFNYVPRNMTLARMIRQHKVADTTTFGEAGLREMAEADIPQVLELYTRYMKRFDMAPVMTKEEITHQFLSGRGQGESLDGRREGQVVWSYVVEVLNGPCLTYLCAAKDYARTPQVTASPTSSRSTLCPRRS